MSVSAQPIGATECTGERRVDVCCAQIATLEATIRQGSHQLKQGKEQAAAAQAAMSEAQAKVARLEALLRKVRFRSQTLCP